MLTMDYFSDKQPCSLHRRYLNSRKRCTVQQKPGKVAVRLNRVWYFVHRWLHTSIYPCAHRIMCYVTTLLAGSQNVLFSIFNPPVLEALARYRFQQLPVHSLYGMDCDFSTVFIPNCPLLVL